MRLWRILVAATALELSGLSALLGLVASLAGINGWFDALANFTPLIGMLSLAAIGLAFASLEGDQRRLVVLLGSIGLVACLARGTPELFRRIPHGHVQGAPLTLVTFNVWEQNFDPIRTRDTILGQDADIVMLQEAGEFLKTARAPLQARYPYAVECDPHWMCGDIILSKRPIIATGYVVPQQPARDGDLNLVWARTTAPDGRSVTVATTHLTWPIPPPPQMLMRRRLIEALHPLAADDMILAGDFNLTPWSEALRDLDSGLKPMIRRTRGTPTWPANIPRMRLSSPVQVLAIDQVFAGPAWKSVKIKRMTRAASDHYGLIIEVRR